MFQFEKLLRANNISESDPELPRAVNKLIQRFRNLQNSITNETPLNVKEDVENELDVIDEKIMQTLPEFFEIEDEEEINKQKAAQQAEADKKAKEKAEADKKAKAEAEQKAKKEEEEKELNTKASNDDDALDKLFRKGKTQVTIVELENAGFNTGFWGDLTPHGCTTKRYKLVRRDITLPYYNLHKL